MKRVLKLVEYFQVPRGLVINKWDINPELSSRVEKWNLRFTHGKFLGKISYDKNIFRAVANFTPILETNLRAKKEIKEIFNNLKQLLK